MAPRMYVSYCKQINPGVDISIEGKLVINFAVIYRKKSSRKISLQKTYKVIAKPYRRKE
jgi:hypothetical protein